MSRACLCHCGNLVVQIYEVCLICGVCGIEAEEKKMKMKLEKEKAVRDARSEPW